MPPSVNAPPERFPYAIGFNRYLCSADPYIGIMRPILDSAMFCGFSCLLKFITLRSIDSGSATGNKKSGSALFVTVKLIDSKSYLVQTQGVKAADLTTCFLSIIGSCNQRQRNWPLPTVRRWNEQRRFYKSTRWSCFLRHGVAWPSRNAIQWDFLCKQILCCSNIFFGRFVACGFIFRLNKRHAVHGPTVARNKRN